MKFRPSFSSTTATLSCHRRVQSYCRAALLQPLGLHSHSLTCSSRRSDALVPSFATSASRRARSPCCAGNVTLSGLRPRASYIRTCACRCGIGNACMHTSIRLASYLVAYGVASSFGRSDTCKHVATRSESGHVRRGVARQHFCATHTCCVWAWVL